MTDRRIAGVASGLAFHFGIVVAWIRLGFVLTTFLWGVGILAYAILWVTLPERSVSDPEDLLPPLATNEPLQVVGILCLPQDPWAGYSYSRRGQRPSFDCSVS